MWKCEDSHMWIEKSDILFVCVRTYNQMYQSEYEQKFVISWKCATYVSVYTTPISK